MPQRLQGSAEWGAPLAERALFLSELSGNVRQLERMLGSALRLIGEGPIDREHLSMLSARTEPAKPPVHAEEVAPEGAHPEGERRQRPYTRRPSKADIEKTLVEAGHVQSKAARLLGVSERQLSRWMDFYGIERARQGVLKKA